MKKLMLIVALLGAAPLSSFAKETKGIEGLLKYECNVVTVNGEVERQYPPRIILAENQKQALALYLNTWMDAKFESGTVTVPYMVPGASQVSHDTVSEVSCKRIK